MGVQTRRPHFGLPVHFGNRNNGFKSKKSKVKAYRTKGNRNNGFKSKESKVKAYRTKGGNRQLLDIHADDLSIYLEFNRSKKKS